MNSFPYAFNASEAKKYERYPQNKLDYPHQFPEVHAQKNLQQVTRQYRQKNEKESTRSKKKQRNLHETSFQSDFLENHIKAFEVRFKNFIESLISCSEIIKQQTLNSRILLQNSQNAPSCQKILQESSCQIKLCQKLQFKIDLQYEKDLKGFLEYICQKFQPQVSGGLVAVADFVWLQYMSINGLKLKQKELKVWAQNIAINKFHKIEQKCFQEDQEARFPNFQVAIKEFMMFYFVTLVLVIEQCFENPYYKNENVPCQCFKRIYSDDDFYSSDQFQELQKNSYGEKKRNY